MAILYKLTDSEGYTRRGAHNELLWDSGVTHTAQGAGVELCSPDVIHAYLSPELAVIMNPIHASISEPRLWECEGEIVAREGQLKVGCKSLKIIREIPLPALSLDFKVAFSIHCALAVYSATGFVTWANKWLSGEDRTARAAHAAYAAHATYAGYAADAAARAARAAYAAADAAARAARAADAAARAARAAYAAADAAARAARAAYAAADAARAARAAHAAHAARAAHAFDLLEIIEKAKSLGFK